MNFTRPMPLLALLALLALLSGCSAPLPEGTGPAAEIPVSNLPDISPERAAANFLAVVARMEPVAESECRFRTQGINCDFRIVVDDRPDQGANAYQTLDRAGRPVIAFTLPLIAAARNADELAFILGHEAAHHIAEHIPRKVRSAQSGSLIMGVLAAAGGADPSAVRAAQDAGAAIGARRYSKEFELEADALGTVIAFQAGFDPERGARFFTRIPDPGNRFLGTHPPNAARMAEVRRAMDGLR